MNRLLCCLLGFPEKDAQVLRSLTRLFRPSLSADWAFEVGVSEGCDLLVCDLDDPGGRHAWNSPAPPGLLRAAASGSDVDAGSLLLRKPLRGHGPAGIVQVLNAAAAIRRPDLAAAALPAETGAAAPAAVPQAFFKPEATAAAAFPVPAPAPAPAAAEEEAAEPSRLSETARRAEAETPAPAPRDNPFEAGIGAGAAEPAVESKAAAPTPAPEAAAAAAAAAAQPAWVSSGAPQQAEAAQDEADIKDILRRMRFATLGTASEARTLLDALRGLRASEQTAVVEGPDLKPLCVLPQARAWFSTARAAEVSEWLSAGNRPVRVLPFGSSEEARDAAGCKDETVRPLEQLMWTVRMRTPPEDLAPYERALFRLKRWPDLGNLPHEPHHMQWCGILTRQQAPLNALAASAGVSPAQAAAFFDACGELGILERTEASAAEIAAVQLPTVSKKGRERISLFKNILGRLRIFRS